MTRQLAAKRPFRAVRRTRRAGATIPFHAHHESQLIYAASGTMQVQTRSGRWLVPPQLAVWAPSGVAHRLDMLSDTELWMIYWAPAVARRWTRAKSLDREFALRVTPLLRELIFAAFDRDGGSERTQLVVRLILNELTEATDAPTFLPLPESAIGKRVSDLAVADPRMLLGISDLASRAATSVRTISRLFPIETGMTFKGWRQRARIVRAIDLLSAGSSVGRAAIDSGFASTAGFSFAFRQVTAMTPSDFLESSALHRAASSSSSSDRPSGTLSRHPR